MARRGSWKGYAAVGALLWCVPCASAVATQQVPDVFGFGASPAIACSCDCCEAAHRLPSEMVAMSGGQQLEYKCVFGSAQAGGQCPKFCFATVVEPSSDYARFCLNSCQPNVATAGMSCSSDGGRTAGGLPVGIGSMSGQGAGLLGGQAGAMDNEFAPDAGEALERVPARQGRKDVRWSLRDLITQRLRAEAGADMAHGAAIGERVRLNQHVVGRNIEKLKRLKEAMAGVETGVDESVAASKSSANEAADAAKKVRMLLEAGRAVLAPMLRDTEVQVASLVKEQAAAAVQEEAAAYALRMEWEKPKDWSTMLANRASAPYLRGLADTRARAQQYQAYAQGLVAEANVLQEQASAEEPQVKASKAQRDILGAAAKESDMEQLLGRAQRLKAEARQYWEAAGNIQNSIPLWQASANAASAYTAAKHQQSLAALNAQ